MVSSEASAPVRVPAVPTATPDGTPFSPEQVHYLDGFFAGVREIGVRFGEGPAARAGSEPVEDDLIPEEQIKRAEHPLDSYYRIVEAARENRAPSKEEVFRFKWNGLFYLSPVKDAYMARLRIPGGQLRSFQLRELARVAEELTTGYIQITTRANLQLRLIQPGDAPELLRRVQSVGLHTRGAGADNVRNLTCNPTAGLDPEEFIDTLPLTQQLGAFLINHREFYDLPRKFNIALDGGGAIGSVEDTNDLGWRAVRLERAAGDIAPGLYFRAAVGGATGHKAFARDLGIVVPPAELVGATCDLLRVYLAEGQRGDRKKARLKHLLERWSLEEFLAAAERLRGRPFRRLAAAAAGQTGPPVPPAHAHIGRHPQRQPGLCYLGVALPVGQLQPAQLLAVAELADRWGSGEIRLTVWQNFIVPGVREENAPAAIAALRELGLEVAQSNLRSGIIACTGSRFCKFAATPTKEHALALADYLEARLTLDQPINIHFTGCPNSCAQHYMGDLGLLGATLKQDGRSIDAYHVFVGGGFGARQAVGRQLRAGVPFAELPAFLERLLRAYVRHRQPGESFQSFTRRHDSPALLGLVEAAGD